MCLPRAFAPRAGGPRALAPRGRGPRTCGPLPRLALAAATALLTTAALSACDLHSTIGITQDGIADVSLEVGIDRSLIDGAGPTCDQVVDGLLRGIVPLDGAELTTTEVPDDAALRCRATTTLTLGGPAWDGQSGRPLWWADVDEGDYRLALPLSQGSGSGRVSPEVADSLGISDQDVVLTVTMPADITSASVGEVDGRTVTVRGADVVLRDLDVRAGGGAGPGRGTLVVGGALAAASLGLGALAVFVRRDHLRRREHPTP